MGGGGGKRLISARVFVSEPWDGFRACIEDCALPPFISVNLLSSRVRKKRKRKKEKERNVYRAA